MKTAGFHLLLQVPCKDQHFVHGLQCLYKQKITDITMDAAIMQKVRPMPALTAILRYVIEAGCGLLVVPVVNCSRGVLEANPRAMFVVCWSTVIVVVCLSCAMFLSVKVFPAIHSVLQIKKF